MHYYWLKKKWFFDIIVSNLPFAFVLNVVPPNIEVESNFSYVYPAPFEVNIALENLDFVIDANLVSTLEFGLEAEVDEEIDAEIEFYLVSTLDFGFAADVDKDIDIISDFDLITVYSTKLEPIKTKELEIVSSYESIQVIDFEFDESIKTLYFDISKIKAILTNVISFKPEINEVNELDAYLSECELVYVYPFILDSFEVILSDVYSFSISSINIENFGIDIIETLPLLITGDIDSASLEEFSLNIEANKYNVNTSFYVVNVLELKMSNIQIDNVDVSAIIDTTIYITRFCDMDGWIVADDLTGKKFRDLR